MNTALTLVPGAWEITSALTNGESLARTIGAGFVALIGVIAVGASFFFAFQKFISENSRKSWATVVSLFILGGLALGGGFAMFDSIAKGTQQTINKIGESTPAGAVPTTKP